MTQMDLFTEDPVDAVGRKGKVAVSVGVAATNPKPRRKRRPKPQVATDAPVNYMTAASIWTLTYPAPATMYSSNGGKPWRTTASVKKSFRQASYLHATAAKLPKGLARVRIDVELRFPTAGKSRDESNYHHLVVKPTVDGLAKERLYQVHKGQRAGTWVHEVGYGLIADDNPRKFLHCTDCPHIRIADEPVRDKAMPFGQVVVTITDLSAEAA